MLTCKQVSKSLAEQDYETLPWRRKMALKFHVALCFVCGKYNRQLMDLYDGIRGYKAYEEQADGNGRTALNEEQKCRIKQSVGAESSR